MIVARGEAVRNFIFSDFLKELNKKNKITLLSIIDNKDLIESSKHFVSEIIPLKKYRENKLVVFFREIIHTAHYKWLWSEAVKYYWGRHNNRVKNNRKEKIKLLGWRILGYPFANRFMLRFGTKIERWLSWYFRPTRDFDKLFKRLEPDLVFNCSHIHGPQADLPMQVASVLKIPTSVFVFSWDNLTSRSRIFPNYDYYLMWNNSMKNQLLNLYEPDIRRHNVKVTGTPQFDFHFNKKFFWSKEKTFQEVGLDPSRPFILYSTGQASDFPDEHKFVNLIIDHIKVNEPDIRPQLIVRTYIKGNSQEMLSMAEKYNNDRDIFFPPIMWDGKWTMPLKEDLYIYTNLLRYTTIGINAASTVTLELMMYGKPVINLGFEPPGSNLPHWSRFSRHVQYEHYKPIVSSGGVMVARSKKELISMLDEGLKNPQKQKNEQETFISKMFDNSIGNNSGQKAARVIQTLVNRNVK